VGGLVGTCYTLKLLPWWLCWRNNIELTDSIQYRKWRIHFYKKKVKDHDEGGNGRSRLQRPLNYPQRGHGETLDKNLGTKHQKFTIMSIGLKPPSSRTSNFRSKPIPNPRPETRPGAGSRCLGGYWLWTGKISTAYFDIIQGIAQRWKKWSSPFLSRTIRQAMMYKRNWTKPSQEKFARVKHWINESALEAVWKRGNCQKI